jgi:antitoxin CcdA
MKMRTNVTISKELLEAARAQGIVLSQLLEKALRDELRKKKEETWKAENREAITSYNEMIEAEGVFSEELRTF